MPISNIQKTPELKYLRAYDSTLQSQIETMLENGTLGEHLRSKYPKTHAVGNDKALRGHVINLKNQFLKKASPLSKITYDSKIHVVNNALGMHSFVSRAHGGKLKSKNEIRISSIFKTAPEEFLDMIVVHELAHLREKEHNKAFYQLCEHMLPDYHQLEFDMRVYLTHLDVVGKLY
jgi:predicted metal-dependent hydrolase